MGEAFYWKPCVFPVRIWPALAVWGWLIRCRPLPITVILQSWQYENKICLQCHRKKKRSLSLLAQNVKSHVKAPCSLTTDLSRVLVHMLWIIAWFYLMHASTKTSNKTYERFNEKGVEQVIAVFLLVAYVKIFVWKIRFVSPAST